MHVPRVSLFLPTYEPDPAHLREAVESVLKQTEQDWELLIHDDASGADVGAMIKPFLSDTRITFLRSPKRLGIGGNWNACLKTGSAPFIQYLFQDDTWEPAYLERALTLMADERIGIVASHHLYAYEGHIDPLRKTLYEQLQELRSQTVAAGRTDGTEFLKLWIARGIHPNLIGEPSFVLIRRTVAEKAGPFRKDMPQGLDVEYWLRCLVRSDLGFITENGGNFRVHGKGASAVNEQEGHGLFDRVGFFGTLLQELPRGETRQMVKRSLTEQFAKMIAKFLQRKQSGGKTGGRGKDVLLKTSLKHPILVLRGIHRFLITDS